MKAVVVLRGGQQYGPYTTVVALQYLVGGALFPHDLARDADYASDPLVPLQELLKQAGLQVPSFQQGNPVKNAYRDLKSFDMSLVWPWKEVKSFSWLQDKRLLYLAGIGLSPIIVLTIAPGLHSTYWLIALYFSALWSMFFFYLFRTPQVEIRACVLCFIFTGVISIPVLMTIQAVPPWNYLYGLAQSEEIPPRFLGMYFGVGLHEELCKAAILFWLVRRPGKILIPQTVVLYGIISGLGFGIYEGISYQQTINREHGVDVAYFLNIARLTTLPFLHAMWTGIAGYFISFSALYRRWRYGLWTLAIGIPTLFHATYNTFGWSILGIASAFLGVLLLMTYLANASKMQQHLKRP